MSVALNWKRVGKKAGPANILNDRFEVLGRYPDWCVRDKVTGERREGAISMTGARLDAERWAREIARSEQQP